ncbi:serine/threonine-protein kinase [Kitasatospora sp. NPDC101183]|uniref:serine/threonine-protein kinase n=1 Tax=Kitasatospora sp. NPDC101183 TaxID=3364100 RepID=UPI0037F673A5
MDSTGPQGRLIDGRFELLERLGGGGMGLVWRARDTALHREVALKEVRTQDTASADEDPARAHEVRERVLREARALARLQHPNVAVIHHIVDSPEHPHPWLVMELAPGGSLADRLARGPLPVPEAARIGRGVLAALRAAHAAGIQHRDVKPANVLLRADGTPVLTDFGIAAVHGATTLTPTGALIGSPEYIAPERIRGAEGNPASDLWSLGMLLYVAVEGSHPLRRSTPLATLAAVLDEPLPPPARSGPLAPVLARLLARDPAGRPEAAELDRALADAERPERPERPEQPERPERAEAPKAREEPVPPRNRRTSVALAAVAGVAVMAAAAWLLSPDPGGHDTTAGGGSTGSGSSPAAPPSTGATGTGPTASGQPPSVNTPEIMALPVCLSSGITLAVAGSANSYSAGERPSLVLTVRNAGNANCRVDLGRSSSAITLDSAFGERIWSSGDCPNDRGSLWAQIPAGSSQNETFTWDRSRSRPQCAQAAQTPAPIGTYSVLAELTGVSGDLVSTRTTIRLTG